jgi:predicted DNA-binding WGR domain protein
MQRFTKINPAQNERRWYVVSWGPTLFGAWAVMRAWGRLGTGWSQRRVEEFATPEQARAEVEAQVQRRERRGYVTSESG